MMAKRASIYAGKAESNNKMNNCNYHMNDFCFWQSGLAISNATRPVIRFTPC